MNFYTLHPTTFLRQAVIENFSSAIWTERYSTEGDVILTTDPTPTMIQKLSEGTLLALSGSKEVMILEAQSIENNRLTVQGTSLLGFTKERLVRAGTIHQTKGWYIPNMKPAERIGYLVQHFLIDGVIGEDELTIGFDGGKQVIPNLTLGDVDLTGDEEDVFVPYGTVYEALIEIAKTEIGMSMYLESADLVGYSLKFKVYKGRNLTSNQTTFPVVRFSPAKDSLTSVKELRSIAGYRNVAYAFASGMKDVDMPPGIAYADASAESLVGFARRTLMVFVDDMTEDFVPGTEAVLTAQLEKKARDALANNNFIRVVDGEVLPQSEYKYGEHYMLGDTIELQGYSGLVQKARITEYIRSQDETGQRAYPTVSVVD